MDNERRTTSDGTDGEVRHLAFRLKTLTAMPYVSYNWEIKVTNDGHY